MISAVAILAIAALAVAACAWVSERSIRALRDQHAESHAQTLALIERVQAPPLTVQAFAPGPAETVQTDADIDAEWAKAPFAAVPFDDDLLEIPGVDTVQEA